ncbi:MAG: AzlD domain-containing protein [Anaerolineaceae bacterium]
MSETAILITILGMVLVTSFVRITPALLLSSRTLPSIAIRWLQLVPAAVLSALLVPSVLVADGKQIDLSLNNIYLLAAIPTFAVAWKTRNLWWAVVVGMVLVALGRYLFGQ